MSAADLAKAVLPSVIAALAGVLIAYLTARMKVNELINNYQLAQRARDEEAQLRARIHYLDPLRVVTVDLRNKLRAIHAKVERGDLEVRDGVWKYWHDIQHDRAGLVAWENHEGHFAISALYLTALYFAHVGKIRAELPYVELSPGKGDSLLERVAAVRLALGGEYGIWDDLQDSLGSYLRTGEGGLMNYREFCLAITDQATFPWFRRLFEFYQDFHLKTREEREAMIAALTALEAALAGPVANGAPSPRRQAR
jgi:BMFP domain-containing protein YqiC